MKEVEEREGNWILNEEVITSPDNITYTTYLIIHGGQLIFGVYNNSDESAVLSEEINKHVDLFENSWKKLLREWIGV